MTIKIPTSFVPRDYQIPMWEALVTKETCKRAVLVWPRRAGKDLTCLNSLAVHALTKRVGNYYYFAPTYQQGKKIIWDGKDRTGRPFLKVFPGYPLTQSEDPSSMILSMDKREMKIYLTNGSMFQVIGTENEDSLVGTNPVGCVFSEYSVMNSKAWELVRPILRENGGFALFTYTARGRNHGYRLYETNKNNPRWHVELHTCETLLHDGRRVITQEMIDEEIEDGMDEDLVRQEYYNDFYASNQGAYYARQMRRALDEGRITTVPWNPQIPVHTAWDLGRRDSTAIWFFQVDYNGNVNLIETYDKKNVALTDHIKFAQAKPYVYGSHFGPHDLAQHEFTTNKTRIETAFSLGFRFTIVPKIPVTDGIDAVRTVLPRCRFDAQKCDSGIEALRQYTKEETGQLGLDGKPIYQDKPKHDWASDYADSFRYLAIAVDQVLCDNTYTDSNGEVVAMPDTIIYDHNLLEF
jgi:phage terminase large subunit